MSNWYLLRAGKTTGPYTEALVRGWVISGQLVPSDRLNRVGTSEWLLPAAIPDFAVRAPVAPAPAPMPAPAPAGAPGPAPAEAPPAAAAETIVLQPGSAAPFPEPKPEPEPATEPEADPVAGAALPPPVATALPVIPAPAAAAPLPPPVLPGAPLPPPGGPPGTPYPPQQMPLPPSSGAANAGGWLSEGWRFFTRNVGVSLLLQLVYLGLGVVLLIIAFLFGVPAAAMGQAPSDSAAVAGLSSLLVGLLVCSVVAAVMAPALTLGVVECFWEMLRTGRLTTARLFAGVRRFWSVIGLSIVLIVLLTAASGLTAATMGLGGAISAVMGYIVGGWMQLALYDMAARRVGAMAALGYSWQLIMRDFGNVLLLGFLGALLNSAGVLACCVGVYVTTPVVQIAWGCCYRDLARR